MLMMRPHPFSYIPGNAFCTILNGASNISLSIIEKRSGGNSSTAATCCNPALLTMMSPSRSTTMTAAPARESLSAQARPIPLAAPVTRALWPVRSTFTDDLSGSMNTSIMLLLRLDKTARPRQDLSPIHHQETSTELSRRPAARGTEFGRRLLPSSWLRALRDKLAFLGIGSVDVAPVRLGGQEDRDHRDQGHQGHVDRDRLVAVVGDQILGDGERQPAGEDRGELVADGGPRVAHAGTEEFREVGRLRPVHGIVPDVDGENDGEPDQGRRPCVEQPEKREGEEQKEDGPKQVQRPTAHAVRERAEEGHGDQTYCGGDENPDEADVLPEPELCRDVAEHEDGQDIEGAVLSNPHS